jgi:hypothetical protein
MNKFSTGSTFIASTYAHRGLGMLAICVSVCCLCVMASTPSLAQDAAPKYKIISTSQKYRDVDLEGLAPEARRAASEKNSKARRARSEAKTAARKGIESGNVDAAKPYLNGFVYPSMTQPEQLSEAGTMRDSFFRTYLRSDLNQGARQQLINGSVLPAMQTIASGADYYPAARLNAIAMIGRLDDRGLVRNGSNTTPPIPSAAAFKFLSSALSNANMPPYLKAAAMQGITRHLKIDRAANGRLLDDGDRNTLTTFAVNTIQGKTAGQDKWQDELSYWLKRRSVQLIGEVGKPGDGGALIDMLVGIANDETQTLWMQFDAVQALRKIDFTGVPAAKASEVVLGTANFLQRSLSQEAARIENLTDDLIYKGILYGDTDLEVEGTRYATNIGKSGGVAGMGGMMMGGGPDDADMMGMGGFGMGMPGSVNEEPPAVLVELPNYQLNLIRRRMKILAYTCNDLLENAKGLAPATGEKEKQLISDIAKFTEKFMKDSSTGIVNLDDEEEMEPQRESFTSQLEKICKSAADNVKNMIASYNGNGNSVIAPAAPVGDPSDPLNGLGG